MIGSKGLIAGRDDYLVKPFNLNEMLARLRAATRKLGHHPMQRFQVASFRLIRVRWLRFMAKSSIVCRVVNLRC